MFVFSYRRELGVACDNKERCCLIHRVFSGLPTGKNEIFTAFRHFPHKYCPLMRLNQLGHRQEVFESGYDSVLAAAFCYLDSCLVRWIEEFYDQNAANNILMKNTSFEVLERRESAP